MRRVVATTVTRRLLHQVERLLLRQAARLSLKWDPARLGPREQIVSVVVFCAAHNVKMFLGQRLVGVATDSLRECVGRGLVESWSFHVHKNHNHTGTRSQL
jgi:hypothetical protein